MMLEKKNNISVAYKILTWFMLMLPIPGLCARLCDPLHGEALYDRYRWSLMGYYGVTVDTILLRAITLRDLKRWPENMQSVELAYTLHQDNFLRRLVYPIVGVTQVALNVAVREGRHQSTIYEFDPYLIFRWANLPWNDVITTSFALAEGVSYTTSIPAVELRHNNENPKRFLNYLMFEATFSLPDHPRLQILARIHHRSGCFGLYHAGNSGSNVIGIGIRYLFD